MFFPNVEPDIRGIRTALGLTQFDLAFLLMTTPGTIHRWETKGGMSTIGKRLVFAFLKQEHILNQLLNAMDPDALIAAVGGKEAMAYVLDGYTSGAQLAAGTAH